MFLILRNELDSSSLYLPSFGMRFNTAQTQYSCSSCESKQMMHGGRARRRMESASANWQAAKKNWSNHRHRQGNTNSKPAPLSPHCTAYCTLTIYRGWLLFMSTNWYVTSYSFTENLNKKKTLSVSPNNIALWFHTTSFRIDSRILLVRAV